MASCVSDMLIVAIIKAKRLTNNLAGTVRKTWNYHQYFVGNPDGVNR
jgi:hypothetical protein